MILYQTTGRVHDKVNFLSENDALQAKGVFYNPNCWDSNPEHVLLCWQVRDFGDSLQITQISSEEEQEKKRVKPNSRYSASPPEAGGN